MSSEVTKSHPNIAFGLFPLGSPSLKLLIALLQLCFSCKSLLYSFTFSLLSIQAAAAEIHFHYFLWLKYYGGPLTSSMMLQFPFSLSSTQCAASLYPCMVFLGQTLTGQTTDSSPFVLQSQWGRLWTLSFARSWCAAQDCFWVTVCCCRHVDMAPKMRTMAASPALQRSFPKEVTRYADGTRTARVFSEPQCWHLGTRRMMQSVVPVSQGKDLSMDLCSTQGTGKYFSNVKISDSLSMSKLTVGTILANHLFIPAKTMHLNVSKALVSLVNTDS